MHYGTYMPALTHNKQLHMYLCVHTYASVYMHTHNIEKDKNFFFIRGDSVHLE